MTDVIFLQALVSEGTATFLPCERFELGDDIDESIAGGRFTFTLRDANGDALDTLHLDVDSFCHPPGETELVVSGLLRAHQAMATASLAQDGLGLASTDLDKPAPHIELVSSPSEDEMVTGRRTIEWRSSTDDGSMIGHSLWYSADGEDEWIPITLGIAGSTADVDFDALPGSDRVLLRVNATSGASVATAISATFKVATPSLGCQLLAPAPGTIAAPGVAVAAHAVVRAWKDGVLTDAGQVQWYSDRDGSLGTGSRRQLLLQRPGEHKIRVQVEGPGGAASAETTITVRRPGTTFVHQAGPDNIVKNSTTLTHPTLDGRPHALIQVTATGSADGKVIEKGTGALGVWYDGQLWNIFNQDMSEIATDRLFNVEVNEPGPNLFVNVGAPVGNTSRVAHPDCDGDGDAILLVTPNWNPNGHEGTYNVANVGVWYDAAEGLWGVFNQGRQPMPVGAAFNIEVLRSGVGVWVHRATPTNTSGDRTFVDAPGSNDNPKAALCVTSTWNPPGSSGVYDNCASGVVFDPVKGRWAIVHLDGTPIPLGSAFNVASTW